MNVKEIPLSIKLEIDEDTKNRVVQKSHADINIALPIRVTQLIFSAKNKQRKGFDGVLKVSLESTNVDWSRKHAADMWDSWVRYSLDMIVKTQILKNDGSLVYSERLKIEHTGAGKTKFKNPIILDFAPPVMQGISNMVTLWVRTLARKITQNQKIIDFAQKVNDSELKIKVARPSIDLTYPMNHSTTKKNEITILGSISSDIIIQNIKMSVNGQLLSEHTRINNDLPELTTFALNQKIPLSLGENIVSVSVKDSKGGLAQKVIQIVRENPGISAPSVTPIIVGERWAVIIGISKYKYSDEGINPLKYADSDAEAFSDYLKSPKGGDFKEDHVLLLVNEHATSAAMRRGLFTFLKRTIEEDLVIFFFCGQGMSEPGSPQNNYILTYDADPDDLPSTAIPLWEIDTAFQRNVRAKKSILLVDALQVKKNEADEATREIAVVPSGRINQYLSGLAETSDGMAVFTASHKGRLSARTNSGERETNLFTYYLLKALSGLGDVNNDGMVTLGETIDYTTDSVLTATQGKQRPSVTGTFDRDLPLGIIR